MGNSLLEYLNKRIVKTNNVIEDYKHPGPVITISREVGCSGLELAYALAQKLDKLNYSEPWKVLSKEIFAQSAQELNLHPDHVENVFKQVDRSTFEELLNAFNDKRYKSDEKIKKTVIEVIRTFATEGFCIIVGRASDMITAEFKNSLHVRLIASHAYRVDRIMEKDHETKENAISFINRVEKERIAYRHALMKKGTIDQDYHDITLNRASFTTDGLVDIIIQAIMEKKILADYKKKNIK